MAIGEIPGYGPSNSGSCIGGVPGGSFMSPSEIDLLTCPGNRGAELTLIAPLLANAAGGVVPASATEDLSPTSSDISPVCANSPSMPCVDYSRHVSGFSLIVGAPVDLARIPEPSTLGLLGLGIICYFCFAGRGGTLRRLLPYSRLSIPRPTMSTGLSMCHQSINGRILV